MNFGGGGQRGCKLPRPVVSTAVCEVLRNKNKTPVCACQTVTNKQKQIQTGARGLGSNPFTVTQLSPGWQESPHSPGQSYPCLFLSIRCYWNTAITIYYICIVSGCFCDTTAELSSYNGDYMYCPQRLILLLSGPLHKNLTDRCLAGSV